MKTRTNKNIKTDSFFANHKVSVFGYNTPCFIHNKEDLKMKKVKRRAISDVIATLMLLAITVAGAVLVSAFFQGNNFFSPDTSNPGTQTASLKIIGYDTRDGIDLSEITALDNVLDVPTPYLCTSICNATPDNLPTDVLPGTEFIVLNVENHGISKVVLQAVEVNGVDHTWDQSTGNLPPTYPAAGKFSIIPTSNDAPIPLSSTNELQRNDEVRLVIKLSSFIDPDINLNEPIRIKFTTNLIDNSETLITSGGVR
jgi:flagellin-like protein